ncbi:hypothetical protein TanjilG_30068 [Lupinus angustifolius]|uniref:DUF4005 domain-containing protein n=1 Tax=Lupinus angustifolius TaxID=3871 RepID=A0A4P1R7G9_LUPAN|nr:PREDICTED: protein IQ-DOMAIN 14-like [Lupinus angustifolius]OIW03792.1 hypothetical protein TanjilG_30068 [Lupinus angustifolius]
MGKATRWLRGLLGMKKEKEHFENSSPLGPEKERKRWSFTRSCKEEVNHITPTLDNDWLRSYFAEKENEQKKHAIGVAAADATAAAAQAEVTAVRLRRHGSGALYSGGVGWWAALKIQSFFRGYLARKALRALKGLVKIQALVRGYLIRKRAAATLYSMQALMRAQVAITSQRAHRYMIMESRLQPEIRARKHMQRFDEIRSEFQSKRLATSCKPSLNGFDESPKFVEIDNHTPHQLRPKHTSTATSECGKELCYPCRVPCRISVPECRSQQDFELYLDECKFSTAHSTPRLANYCMLHNAPPTPVRTVCGDTLLSHCPDSPNYMANTQSSKAKLRSHSAPRQRPEHKKRLSVNETIAARNSISSVRMHSNPQTEEYSILKKVVLEYYVNWESQSKI